MDASDKPQGKCGRCCRDAVKTRERILEAARRLFAREGYEHVGVREIAASVGVDAALINRYFGSKRGLFAAAVTGMFLLDGALAADRAHFGERLARELLTTPGCVNAEEIDVLQLLTRSAVSPEAAPLVSQAIHAEFVTPLANLLGGKDAPLRAAMITSYVIGIATLRMLLKSPYLRLEDEEKGMALLLSAIQACLDEPHGRP